MDDEPAMLKQANDCGLRTLGIQRSYNSTASVYSWAVGLEQAGDILHRWLDKWEGEYR